MSDKVQEALGRFEDLHKILWEDLLRDLLGEEELARESEDQRRRRLEARAKVLSAWHNYVDLVGSSEWQDFEDWVHFCGGNVRVASGPEKPQTEVLEEKYGQAVWLIFEHLEAEARRLDEDKWPKPSSRDSSYSPTVSGPFAGCWSEG